MATRKPVKKKKPVKKTPAKKKPKPKRARNDDLMVDELEAARAELQRIGGEDNVARRNLEAQLEAARSREQDLRAELDAVHLDLRTALADLEISRAAEARAVDRATLAQREAAEAREAERLAARAHAEVVEQLRALNQQNHN